MGRNNEAMNHATTALAISESANGKILGSVESLFLDYDDKLAGIKKICDFVHGKDDLLNYFVHSGGRSDFMFKDLYDYDRAKAKLDSEFWSKAMEMTDVMECMSATKRNEWHENIRTDKCPSFDRDTVITTIRNLLLSRGTFLADKVDGVFR